MATNNNNATTTEERIHVLETFQFEDHTPVIEAPALNIFLESEGGLKNVDVAAFETRWAEETPTISQLGDLVKQGLDFVYLIYSYRNCSKPLPQVKDPNQPNKDDIYEKHYEVLEEEVKKMRDLMLFQQKTIQTLCGILTNLITGGKRASDQLLWKIGEVLDLLLLLDEIKNAKACLSNDLSFYKRALGFKKSKQSRSGPLAPSSGDEEQELNQLNFFIAYQNSITTALKTSLKKINDYESILVQVGNMSAECVDEERHITPHERFALLRVMAYTLILIDDEEGKRALTAVKHLKLDKFQKHLKRYPVIPLYGDMQTNVVVILKKSKGFDEKLWTMAQLSDNKLAVEYELIHHLDVLRERHETYLAKWTTMISEIKITQRQGKPVWYALAKDVIATVLQGMRMLSDLTARVLLQAAWKYAKPNNNPEFKDITDYERAIKLNYNKEERYALVEVLAMIKGVLVVMLGADTLLAPIIRRHIHDQLQEFIQHELRELMAKTMKSTKPKKRFLQNELLTLRFFAADWYNSAEPQDVALEGKKPKENEKFNIPTRTVAPSSTQLDMIRNMLFGFMHQTGKKQMYSESDLGGSSQKIFADFYHQSFFYRYLLDYTTTLREITDVGDLWYREFYLDLNERIQFPIDMSLPWILTDHILESGNTSMMEYVLYPLDIYNDAASRALNELKSRFLYDEIEAEVNLAFEQLVYKLTNQIYTYCKIQASSIMLDKPYKQQLELNFPDRVFRFHVPKSRFGVLLQQRHIKLLGRSIDFADLLTQRVNNMIRANLDLVIARFEAADITSIIELETMLDNIKLTHHLLSQYLPLDQFDALLAEVNESTSLVSLHGRILLHIIFELTIDLTPNFVYNMITQRFIRAPHIFTDPVPRQPMPKSDNPTYLFGNKPLERGFMSQLDLTRPFVGLPHLKSIIRIIGKSNLSLLISEILENMKLKLVNVLHPYVKELMEGLPLKSTLPRFDYGLEGGFGYFPLKLKMIIEYPDLVNQVFQHFREWGNSLVLLNLFDIALAEHDQTSVVTAAPFLGIVPNKLYNLSGSDVTPMLNVMKTLQANLEKNRHIAKSLEALNDLTVSAQKADKLYRPTVENYSLFKNALVQITQALEPFKEEWFGFPDNPQMQPDNEILPVEQSFEFYRFWSGLQFVFLIDIEANAALGRPSMELFGDGIHWAGCAIINALQQKQRFNVFDFAYHVSKMGEVLAATNDSTKIFLQRVATVKELNNSIFRILEAFLPCPPDNDVIFHPPATEQESTFLYTTMGEARAPQPVAQPDPKKKDKHASIRKEKEKEKDRSSKRISLRLTKDKEKDKAPKTPLASSRNTDSARNTPDSARNTPPISVRDAPPPPNQTPPPPPVNTPPPPPHNAPPPPPSDYPPPPPPDVPPPPLSAPPPLLEEDMPEEIPEDMPPLPPLPATQRAVHEEENHAPPLPDSPPPPLPTTAPPPLPKKKGLPPPPNGPGLPKNPPPMMKKGPGPGPGPGAPGTGPAPPKGLPPPPKKGGFVAGKMPPKQNPKAPGFLAKK